MTLHEYPDLIQRSDEWHAIRCGLVTASTIGRLIVIEQPSPLEFACRDCGSTPGEPCVSKSRKVRTPVKTAHSARLALAAADQPLPTVADNETSRGLIHTLAAERITGRSEDTPMTSDMWRGIDSEPYARDAYAKHYAPVDECGFMVRDYGAFKIGCSPDGLVGDDGGFETKAPRARHHISTVLHDEVPPWYRAQVQTCLLVSGRKWWDFASFHGGMHLYVKRVTPDPDWQAAILAAASWAEREISAVVDAYKAATEGLPLTERIPDLDEITV